LDSVLNPILLPLLRLGPMFAILVISFLLTVITTVIYKYVTNQKLLKGLKEELKALQKEMKALKDKPEKIMKKQKQLMSKNMEYMRHSMRATLVTIIPVIIVFGWMNAHLAYEPLVEGEPFNITLMLSSAPTNPPEVDLPQGIKLLEGYPKRGDNTVLYSFVADAGSYVAPPIRFAYNGAECEVPVIVIENGGVPEYATPIVECKAGDIIRAKVSNKPVKPLGNISIFGWRPGWFGTYIILSILFSMLIRKLLKVY